MVGKDAFLSLEYLQSESRQAEAMPAKEAAFRRLYLNQWPEQADNAFIDLQTFDTSARHPTTEIEIRGRQAYGGLDVGAVSDLTPLVWVVPCPHIEGAWDVFVRVFLPEAALTTSRNADLYRSWRDAGWLTLTPGEVVDYRRVTDAILADARQLDIRRLTIDAKFQGIQIATTLADQGVPVMEMPQTHTAFAAPMKELERLLRSGMLHHGRIRSCGGVWQTLWSRRITTAA
jgi:phage terminase large subunit-like protein